MREVPKVSLLGILLLAAACAPSAPPESAARFGQQSVVAAKISRFGEYTGHSPKRFDQWVRQSQYVSMSDGVRLAADIVRPAVDGKPVDEAFPAIVTFSRYHRNPTGPMRAEREGRAEPDIVFSSVDTSPMLQRLVTHGYVVVSVAVRGSGASFGRQNGIFSARESDDCFEVIDWIVGQPWSTDEVGMFGGSYLGITQYMAASRHHPALRAIVPDVTLYDLYDIFHDGGIYKDDYVRRWGAAVRALDFEIPPVPVDEDVDGKLLARALSERAENWQPERPFAQGTFRDTVQADWNWTDYGPIAVLDRLNESGVAIYHYTGWYDAFIYQAPQQLLDYPGPDRLTIGPWGHGPYTAAVNAERRRINEAEHHRWFDYWLKGIENGVADDAMINYAVNDVPGERWTWQSSPRWPVPGVEPQEWYLTAERAGSVASINDGSLSREPVGSKIVQTLAVDVTTTTGTGSRWINCIDGILSYPDMTPNDMKSLTFTTPPLEDDVTVVGYPSVEFRTSSSARDGDFYVLLEEVEPHGWSHLVTEGQLRLSMRKTARAAWHNRLWRRQFAEDVLPVVPGEEYEVEIGLLPTAYLFNRGHRIRVTIMGADRDNTVLPEFPEAVLGIGLGGEDGSRLVLPVLTTG